MDACLPGSGPGNPGDEEQRNNRKWMKQGKKSREEKRDVIELNE